MILVLRGMYERINNVYVLDLHQSASVMNTMTRVVEETR
jgi:hypothetical protein